VNSTTNRRGSPSGDVPENVSDWVNGTMPTNPNGVNPLKTFGAAARRLAVGRGAGGVSYVSAALSSELGTSAPCTARLTWADGLRLALTRTISMVRTVTVHAIAARNTRPIATKGCMPKV
jgi:hypothetical protein